MPAPPVSRHYKSRSLSTLSPVAFFSNRCLQVSGFGLDGEYLEPFCKAESEIGFRLSPLLPWAPSPTPAPAPTPAPTSAPAPTPAPAPAPRRSPLSSLRFERRNPASSFSDRSQRSTSSYRTYLRRRRLGIFEDAATYSSPQPGAARRGAPLPLPQPTEAPRRGCCASSRRWNFSRPPLPVSLFVYVHSQ